MLFAAHLRAAGGKEEAEAEGEGEDAENTAV